MISWRLRSLVVTGGLALLFGAHAARAQTGPSRVSLRWAAPDECPDDVRLVHAIEGLLGEALPDAGEQSLLTVHVNVHGGSDAGYAAKLSFTSPQGSEDRFLEHPSCEKLVDAVALVVALAIDPERVRATQRARDAQPEVMRQGAARAEPVAVAPAVAPILPTPDAARDAPPLRAPDEREPLRGMRLALHGVTGAGPLPSFGAGVEAALGWHRGSFRAEALGRYWVPRDTAVNVAPSATLELELATLGARACWLPLRGAWQLAACVGGDIGQLRGDGLGVESPRTRAARYSAVSAGFEVAYARSRLAPEGGLELSGALERPPFGVRDDGRDSQVFRPAAWGFNVFFGLAFEL
jgi:hypothetical protein